MDIIEILRRTYYELKQKRKQFLYPENASIMTLDLELDPEDEAFEARLQKLKELNNIWPGKELK